MPESQPEQSPFKLNRGRVFLLVMGAVLVVIAVSTWFGGIEAYQHLREANAEAVSGTLAQPAGAP